MRHGPGEILVAGHPATVPQSSQYDAFVSYSHAHDAGLAPALQAGLHRFAKPLWQRRALRIFLDNANLAANPALWNTIEQALAASRYFILLASPDVATSKWVDRELDYWCRYKTPQTILIVLTGGNICWGNGGDFDWRETTALPRRLEGVFQEEPRWIDARVLSCQRGLSLRDPAFRDVIADLAAPLHGRAKDELIGEDLQQHRRAIRFRNGAIAALALLLIVASISAFVAIQQRNEAKLQALIANDQKALAEAQRDRALRSQSLFLAEKSAELRQAGDTATAVRLALEALPKDLTAPDRPYVRQVEIALARALASNREKIVLRGHTAAIIALHFSPNGDRLITASKDGSARIWDVASGSEQVALSGGGGTVSDARFSPDGNRVLTFTQWGEARLWHASSGELIASINDQPQKLVVAAGSEPPYQIEPEHYAAMDENKVFEARFSPDGDTIVAVRGDGRVCFWDGLNGAPQGCVEVQREGSIRSITDEGFEVAFTSDGRSFVTAGDREVNLWDFEKRRPYASFAGHQIVRGIDISPNSKWLLVTDSMGWASLWDLSPPARRAVLSGHGDFLYGTISPDGKSVIIGSEDHTARLWVGPFYGDAGKLKATLSGHTAPVVHAAFSTDSTLVATASLDGSVRVWAADDGRLIETLRGHDGSVLYVAFSPVGNTLATAGNDGTARLWTFGDIRTQFVLEIGKAGVDAGWSSDGKTLVTPHGEASAQVWDATTGAPLAKMTGHGSAVVDAVFAADADRAVTRAGDGAIRLWHAATGTLVRTLTSDGEAAEEMVLSADGRSLFARTGDNSAKVWSAEDGELIREFRSKDQRILGASMSPDGRLAAAAFASAGSLEKQSSEIRLWDVATGEMRARVTDRRERIHQVGFTPDSSAIYATADDGTVRLWDLNGETIGSPLVAYQGLWDNPDLGVRFSGDGKLMATFSDKKESRIQIWNAMAGKVITVMEQDSDETTDIAFSPNGVWLASGGYDGVVRLWDLKTGLLFAEFRGHSGSVRRVLFSPSGDRILTTATDGTARIWSLPAMGQDLIELALKRVPQPLTAVQRERFFLAPK
jgi:WD40 repeat protein